MIIFVTYGVLVATHKGEFWPFSIYPMFSRAGKPWVRAIVTDVTDLPDSTAWQTKRLQQVQDKTVSMQQIGVHQIDFSDFVSKTKQWDWPRKRALMLMFGKENIGTSHWMVSKVKGHLNASDSVIVKVVPLLMVKSDTVLQNPNLSAEVYTSH